MTSFLTVGKRAEEFADLVDAVTTSSSGARRPQHKVEPLADLVVALRSVPAPAPRPEFTTTLRERLLAEAATVLSPARPALARPAPPLAPRPLRRPNKVVVVATALVAVGGSAGVASAAQGALPGEALYPVKRVIEGAQVRLSTSDTGRGRDLLAQASNRLQEVGGLLETSPSPSDPGTLESTVDDFNRQAVDGSDLLFNAFGKDGDRAHLAEVRSFAGDSMETLSRLAAVAPPDLDDDLLQAADTLLAVDARAASECVTCADGEPPLQLPPDFGVPGTDDDTEATTDGSIRAGDETTPSDVPLSRGSSEQGSGSGTGEGGTGQAAQPGTSAGGPHDPTAPTGGQGSGGGVAGGPAQGPVVGGSSGAAGGSGGAPAGSGSGQPSSGSSDDESDDEPSDEPSDEPDDEPSDEPDGGSDQGSNGGSSGGQTEGDSDHGGSDPGDSDHGNSGPGGSGQDNSGHGNADDRSASDKPVVGTSGSDSDAGDADPGDQDSSATAVASPVVASDGGAADGSGDTSADAT